MKGEGEINIIFIFSLILKNVCLSVLFYQRNYFKSRLPLHNFAMLFRTFLVPPWHHADCVVFFFFSFFSVVILSCRQPHALREQVTSKWPGQRAQRQGQEGALRKGMAWYRNRKKPYWKILFQSMHAVYLFQIRFLNYFFQMSVDPMTSWEDFPAKECWFHTANSARSPGLTRLSAFYLCGLNNKNQSNSSPMFMNLHTLLSFWAACFVVMLCVYVCVFSMCRQ